MEQELEFKQLVDVIKQLQHCASNGDNLEKHKQIAQQTVEVEFEKLLNALALRKRALLSEIELKFQAAKKLVDEQRDKINTAIKTCQGVLESGAGVYSLSRDTALGLWKTAGSLNPQYSAINPVTVHLAATSLEEISRLGEVLCLAPVQDKFVEAPIPTPQAPILPQPLAVGGNSPIPNREAGQFLIGRVSTLAGPKAKFNMPYYTCLDEDSLLVCDSENNSIRRVNKQGGVSVFFAKEGELKLPTGIVFYQKESCFFVCSTMQHMVKKISATGKIWVFAGSGQCGGADGAASRASFNRPLGITLDQQTGTLFVTDNFGHTIRKITQQGEVSTLAGGKQGCDDGAAALFNYPGGIHFDAKTNSLFISDFFNNSVRQFDLAERTVKTLCTVKSPSGITMVSQDALVVSSRDSHQLLLIKRREGKWEPTVMAGNEQEGSEDGEPLSSKFNGPRGVCYDPTTETCYVSDSYNHTIRKLKIRKLNII